MNMAFGMQPTVYTALSMIALSFMIDSLFNLSGKTVFRSEVAYSNSGRHSVTWDARDASGRPLPSGIYICRLETGRRAPSSTFRRMVLMR